jgi:hypothetical protein
MEAQKKRKLNSNLFLLCFLFLAFNVNAQKILTIENIESSYNSNDSISFVVKNISANDLFINVQLEKFVNKEWVTYTDDIFTKPFQKVTLILKLLADTSYRVVFLLEEPEWCEDPKWSKKYKRKQQLNLKKGKFRFKLLYANNISLDDNKTLTSNEFEIY